MTGTALTEEKEFREIYNMDVVEVPTNRPVARVDLEDAVYKTKKGKFNAVVESVIESHEKGQPVLVGTITIETSELLSEMLRKKGIQHNVLNAKYHEKKRKSFRRQVSMVQLRLRPIWQDVVRILSWMKKQEQQAV